MVERQFGPYRLVRQIAVGGMAEIHLAKTKGIAGFEKYVALKMIHPNFAEDEQFIQMLIDEAKIAVQLNHGNIAQTFDLGRVGDTFYITMEYVDGSDLYKILRQGSELEIVFPLDVCAFIAKEVASALDHAHRKRDHVGKSLGIVHRDVSPQNVLLSYAGEVKLVDFGIAKATMKARQTAAGVIKGKYYYMSPEQAWGDPIDPRSDIFSAGIVLYEMITGQMLYLEEDLNKLLDMARRADIAPPTTLRPELPAQLEKIVMRALAKLPSDRYQYAADFATDLERFLHAYSPQFTTNKVSGLLKQVIGLPHALPDAGEVEREGIEPTLTLSVDDLIHTKDELHDENSVIFRVADLKGAPPAAKPAIAPRPVVGKIPSIQPRRQPAPSPAAGSPSPPLAKPPAPQPPAVTAPPARASTRPRMAHEPTRELGQAPPPPGPPQEDSGLLAPPPRRPAPTPPKAAPVAAPPPARPWERDSAEALAADDHDTDDLANIGERTMITGAPTMGIGGFMMDVATEDGVDATMVTGAPRPDDEAFIAAAEADDDDGSDGETVTRTPDPRIARSVAARGNPQPAGDDDGPTEQRDFRGSARPRVDARRAAPPPALAAKIHAPAVSELRKPRPSRKTPGAGVPQAPNVLQRIVGAQASEAMPAPANRATKLQHAVGPNEDSNAGTLPGADLDVPRYGNDPTGMPLTASTPPPGTPVQPMPGVPPHLQPYAMYPPQPQGYPPNQQFPQYPPGPQNPYGPNPYPSAQGLPGYAAPPQPIPVTPGALYPFAPQQPQNPMTLTGQLRLWEVDEIPSQYKVSGNGPKWLKLAIAGVVAVSVAAGATYAIIRSTRDSGVAVDGSVRVDSVPSGASVLFDGERLTKPTPVTIDHVMLGTRHEVKVELAHHRLYTETVDIPSVGGTIELTAVLKPITGTLVVHSTPPGAEIRLNGEVRGRAPTTLSDIDMDSVRMIELRLQGYQPYIQKLEWPPSGELVVDPKLAR